MSEILSALGALRRPRLLIRAARHGLADYSRDRTLMRLIEAGHSIAPEAAVQKLMQVEARIEIDRQKGDGTYSVARHIELLIALMAEARMLVRPMRESDRA